MPNAQHIEGYSYEKILLLGQAGAGKTTQILTFPGKKFVYFFDPNGPAAIAGYDVDFELFAAESRDLDLSIKLLKAGSGDRSRPGIEPKTYIEWEKHFHAQVDSGAFEKYDLICFDSLTTFSDIVMDRILHLQNRMGKQPELGDYAIQKNTINNVMRTISGYRSTILLTAHVEMVRDEITQRVERQIVATGKLRERLPILFSNIFPCYSRSDTKGPAYFIQTMADREWPQVRTTIHNLQFMEDITIKDFRRPQDFGIGALLKKANRLPTPKAGTQTT